jgi:hypothetical protein
VNDSNSGDGPLTIISIIVSMVLVAMALNKKSKK